MKIVLDTCVLVAGMRSRLGASFELLQRIDIGQVVAVATPALFFEYEDLLLRPEHRLVHGLTPEDVEIFLADFARKLQPIRSSFQWRPQLADANDEMVLEAAINGPADAIITFNRGDFLPAAVEFGIQVMRPAELLRRLNI